MLWIPVKVKIARGDDRKLERAAALLDIHPRHALGLVVGLWAWAAEEARDGCLATYTEAEIARSSGWDGNPGDFIAALLACGPGGRAGFLERDPERGLVIHHWREDPSCVGAHVERSEAKVRDTLGRRAQKRAESPVSGNVSGNVGGSLSSTLDPRIDTEGENGGVSRNVSGNTVSGNGEARAALDYYDLHVRPAVPSRCVDLVRARLASLGESALYMAILSLAKGRGPVPAETRPLAEWFFETDERVREYAEARPILAR